MLVSMKAILEDANTNYYGVMAMNSINIEMARAGIMAAEEEHSPIIIQFGPGQMKNHAHMEEMLPVVEELAKRVHVPVALNLDHGSDFYVIADCINAGFTNVMFDGSSLPYEENVKRTAIVSALAHGMGQNGELFYYGDWIRKPGVAICSCNDGLRPVLFKIERTELKSDLDYTPVP